MRFVTDLSKGILGKPDPVELWELVLYQLDDFLLLNPNTAFIFPACGHCTEADITVKRMTDLGVEHDQIKDRLYLFDKYNVFTNEAKRKGYVNVFTGNFLDMEINKLDNCVILMNPPYLKRTWLKFVEKSIELNPSVVATINPDPTNNRSDFGKKWRSICRQNGLVYRKNVTDYFSDVSSGRISAFILNRSEKVDETLLNSDDPILDSILGKVLTDSPTSFVIRGSQAVAGYGGKTKSHSISEVQDSDHLYPSIMSCGNNGLTIKFSNKKSENKKHIDKMQGRFIIMNRFYGKNNPDPVYIIEDIENYNLSYDCMAFKLYNGETLDNFNKVYGSKTYRFVMNKMRDGGFDMTQSNFMSLIKLDLTRSWEEDEIQDYLGLTEEEIERINKGN
jgi:hypothetical protein